MKMCHVASLTAAHGVFEMVSDPTLEIYKCQVHIGVTDTCLSSGS